MFGKYHHRECAITVACSSFGQNQLAVVSAVLAFFLSIAGLLALIAPASARAEGRLPQIELSRAPAPVAEQNAALADTRDNQHCDNCGSQAKIVLAWDYPAEDNFLLFYASSPSEEFTQIFPAAPVVRAENGEYEVEIDAGAELGASVGKQVCFKVRAASAVGDFVTGGEDFSSSALMCSELQS